MKGSGDFAPDEGCQQLQLLLMLHLLLRLLVLLLLLLLPQGGCLEDPHDVRPCRKNKEVGQQKP